MMLPIQKNLFVNTDRISVVQLRKVSDRVRIEVVVDGKSYIVDDDKVDNEFRNFLRGEFDGDKKQFVSL